MPLDFLHGIDVVEILDGARPIRTAKSSIIGLVGTAGKGPVNTPVLIIGNRREGQAIFGTPAEDGFTIPNALKAIFDVTGATVVVINVADATEDRTTVTSQSNTFVGRSLALPKTFISNFVPTTAIKAPFTVVTAGAVVLPAGATLVSVKDATDTNTLVVANLLVGDNVVVHYTATLAEGVDYTVNYDTGVLTSPSTGSKILENATIVATYQFVDPTQVNVSDVVGSVSTNGNFTGIEALAAAKSTVFVQPRILIAPGFTHIKVDAATANAVGVELNIMAHRLKAIAVLDTPNNTKEDAVAYQQDFAATDRVFPHYPFYRVLSSAGDGSIVAQPASARIAGLICLTDNTVGFWNSPSNQEVPGILGLDKPIDFALSSPDTVSNYLNVNNVATTIHEMGLRLWGNRVADGSFLSGRRTADMVEESILLNHLWAVDRNITKAYVETVVEGVNDYLRILKAQGAILGGKAWADPTLNTPTVIADGQLYIDFEFTRPTPAEHLTFRAHLVNNYITSIFDVNS